MRFFRFKKTQMGLLVPGTNKIVLCGNTVFMIDFMCLFWDFHNGEYEYVKIQSGRISRQKFALRLFTLYLALYIQTVNSRAAPDLHAK